MRVSAIFAAVVLAVVLVGCEEGEAIDIDPGPGSSTDVFLEVTTTQPITAGSAVAVRATVTEDGATVPGVPVAFTAEVNSDPRPAIPSPVDTSILGFSDTTISTLSADRSLNIRATSGTATSNLVIVTLEPRL
jgi:hypothetical protein